MADFTPILIKDNVALRLSKTNEYGAIKTALQSVVNAFNAMTFLKEGEQEEVSPLLTAELSTLLNNPNELILDRLTGGESIEVGGLKIESNKAFEIIEKPTGYDAFINALNQFKSGFINDNHNTPGQFYYTCSIDQIPSFYSIDESNTVVNSSTLTSLINAIGKVYTKNEHQNSILNFITDVFESYVSNGANNVPGIFNHTGGTGTETLIGILKEYVESCDPKTGTFTIHNKLGAIL